MTERAFDPIVIGHNSFFGVDHLSAVRGQEREVYFADPKKILQVIEWSMERGAGGLMMSTHARASVVAQLIRQNRKILDGIRLYPLLPYVQKYVTAANEKGVFQLIRDILSHTNAADKFNLVWNGAKGVLAKDIFSILSNLISVEMQPFRDFNIPCVFLHDIFTDLALALGLRDIIAFYHEEISKSFQAEAGFATKNLPFLLDRFKEWGFSNPRVMPHINKLGFRMNPTQAACEEALSSQSVRVMAMSTLASGYLKPEEAFEYIAKFPVVESIVVSASSLSHIEETFFAIKKHMLKDGA